MALMHFTRCSVQSGSERPFLPTDEQIRDDFLPKMNGPDVVVLTWTDAVVQHVAELPTVTGGGFIVLMAHKGSKRKFGSHGLIVTDM